MITFFHPSKVRICIKRSKSASKGQNLREFASLALVSRFGGMRISIINSNLITNPNVGWTIFKLIFVTCWKTYSYFLLFFISLSRHPVRLTLLSLQTAALICSGVWQPGRGTRGNTLLNFKVMRNGVFLKIQYPSNLSFPKTFLLFEKCHPQHELPTTPLYRVLWSKAYP